MVDPVDLLQEARGLEIAGDLTGALALCEQYLGQPDLQDGVRLTLEFTKLRACQMSTLQPAGDMLPVYESLERSAATQGFADLHCAARAAIGDVLLQVGQVAKAAAI